MKYKCIFSVLVLVWASVQMAWSAAVQLVEQPPATISNVASNVYLIDFGRVAFGNLSLTPPLSRIERVLNLN